MKRFTSFVVFVSLLNILICGCTATYSKETLSESVVELCREEYSINVKSKVVGKTLAIYLPLPSLFDITLSINKKAQEMMQNVILSASRIVLSTDADIKYYCVIAQDIRLPEIQVIVIKYVTDVKRAFFQDISRGEYFKRTIFDININPQSKKEESVKKIFSKHNINPELEESVLEEFFRSTPIEMKDFGYWQDEFYVKDIEFPEFVAEQMSYRIRNRFREQELLKKEFLVASVLSSYDTVEGGHFFNIIFDVKYKEILKLFGEISDKNVIYENIFLEVADCIYGYKFKDFDMVKIIDKNSPYRLFVSKSDIYNFKKKKLDLDTILQAVNAANVVYK